MKKIHYSILCLVALLTIFTGCSEDDPKIEAPPSEADADFTFSPSVANDNIIDFTSTGDAFLKKWDFGTGATATGNTATATFPVKGTYTVTLTVYTGGGSISASQDVVIAETDPTLLDIPVYNMLTGGNADLDGKTWVVDAAHGGHFGVGAGDSFTPNYYQAGPNEKAGAGLYDDKFNFKLSGFSFTQTTNGDVFINTAQGPNFPGAYSNAGDLTAPFTAPTGLTWTITEEGDAQFLTVPVGSFIGYYTGTNKYQILNIEENEIFLRYLDAANAGLTWYIRLIPEGFTEPVDPPEYKIEDIEENFEGATLLGFLNDSQASVVKYDNPAPVPINTSAKVGKYVKTDGSAGEFGNIQIPLDYKMDIRDRHVFKIKVFIPSYNDYVTTGGEPWQSYNTLQKQVSIKLQNSDLGGNAYTTQAEIIKNNLATDQWIELTFDFSAFAAREDFDKVVVQMGGEAIFTGGIFFFDDLELQP